MSAERRAAGPDWLDPATVLVGEATTPLIGIAVALAVLYTAGLVLAVRRGRRWPVGRVVAFMVGCLVLALAVAPGVETWGTRLISVFMFQQLTLMIAVPPLLVLGSPGSLLLAATPHRGIGRLILVTGLTILRSRVARVAVHPVITVGLFMLAYYGVYLTGAANGLIRSGVGHAVLESMFLATGVLFVTPAISSDPLPVRPSPIMNLLEQFIEMGTHAFFGVIVMFGTTLLVPAFAATTRAAGLDPLEDQRIAGALAWSYGEGPAVLVLLWVMHRWFAADTRRSADRDRRIDAAGDTELEEYNSYLTRLGHPAPPTRESGRPRPE